MAISRVQNECGGVTVRPMKIAVFGTGSVGAALASKLISLGHEVRMGSRSATNEKALAWAKQAGAKASVGTYAEAAQFAELLVNCTKGEGTVEAFKSAGAAVDGKVIVDISNPLDFSKGFPPSLFVTNTDSLAEQLQRAVPTAHVVKALNTMNNELMVNPKLLKEATSVFLAGNDAGAKAKVTGLLASFGWEDIIDCGDLSAARGCEQLVMHWVRLMGALKTPMFNFKIVR